MLLDEPTTGLDPRSKRDVQRFVAEVRRDEEVTILLTTHDMDEAELLCDRIGFLSGGRLVAEGTPARAAHRRSRPGRPLDQVDMEAVFMALTGETSMTTRRRTGRGRGGESHRGDDIDGGTVSPIMQGGR